VSDSAAALAGRSVVNVWPQIWVSAGCRNFSTLGPFLKAMLRRGKRRDVGPSRLLLITVLLAVGIASTGAAHAQSRTDRRAKTDRFVWGRGTGLPVSQIPGVTPGNDAPRLACAGARLCVAIDQADDILATRRPTRQPAVWKRVQRMYVSDVACPSASLCVGVSGTGAIVRSFTPARPGSWRTIAEMQATPTVPYANPGVGFAALACPSTRFCVAVGGGELVAIRLPGATHPRIAAATIDPPVGGACGGEHEPCQTPLLNVTCPTWGRCVAMSDIGGVYTSSDPSIPSTWKPTRVDSPVSGGLTCPSAELCLAAGATTNVLASPGLFAFDPVTARSYGFAWRGDVDDIFCPLAGVCFGVDLDGASISQPSGSSLPLRGWTTQDLSPLPSQGVNGVASIACPTSTVCLATDGHANVYRGTIKATS
jgi:hypothetical protein